MIAAGANGVRFTFGFGVPTLHDERARLARVLQAENGCKCLTIADLNGGKFRLGTFTGSPSLSVECGARVVFTHAPSSNPTPDNVILPIPDPRFFSYLKKGSMVTIGDGVSLSVTSVESSCVVAELLRGGIINHARGLSVQSKEFQPLSLTPRDLEHLEHVLSTDLYDAVALSFVSSPDELCAVRDAAKRKGKKILLIAKIETAAALERLDAICDNADCIMAARGDLALSMPWVDLPEAVAQIASVANAADKPWILATQIVEGLERFAFPTRAEICDLGHWMSRQCSGVLLSTETAFGSRPVDAVTLTSHIMRRYSC